MLYAINYLNTLAVHFFSCVLGYKNAEILVTQLQTTINYGEMGEGVTFQMRKGNSRRMGGILVAKFEISVSWYLKIRAATAT